MVKWIFSVNNLSIISLFEKDNALGFYLFNNISKTFGCEDILNANIIDTFVQDGYLSFAKNKEKCVTSFSPSVSNLQGVQLALYVPLKFIC